MLEMDFDFVGLRGTLCVYLDLLRDRVVQSAERMLNTLIASSPRGATARAAPKRAVEPFPRIPSFLPPL